MESMWLCCSTVSCGADAANSTIQYSPPQWMWRQHPCEVVFLSGTMRLFFLVGDLHEHQTSPDPGHLQTMGTSVYFPARLSLLASPTHAW